MATNRCGFTLNPQASHSLQHLNGIGPQIVARLQRIGITCVRDFLFHLPYRYQDRTRVSLIDSLQSGQNALVVGQVQNVAVHYGRRRSLSVSLGDHGASLSLRFFHFRTAQQHSFKRDAWVCCYGEVRRGLKSLEMVHPEYRIFTDPPQNVTSASLTPIYPSTEGLGPATVRKLVSQAFTLEINNLEEYLPAAVREQFNLMPIQEAVETLHYPPPDADTDALLAGTHRAQQRLATEELLAHHLALSRLRDKHRSHTAPALSSQPASWIKLQAHLGFTLTNAQCRVIKEVIADLQTTRPAMRLLQGDVGCGKTVVAAAAALSAIDAGYQVALMVPTELLSAQHRKTFCQWFAELDIQVDWLVGKMPSAARKQVLTRIKSGEAKMVIGTHALFQQQVEFHRLGLMIVDEQHRFGVDQRLALRNKATAAHQSDENNLAAQQVPHQLIMSATPIPRSLAMLLYADLDVSRIDESPPGRQQVKTVVLPNNRRTEIASRIRNICQKQNQVYWVCPLIEESDKLQAQAATATCEVLSKLLPEITIALIHGRMKPAQKEQVMQRFYQRQIDLLVATTVIEVGVDVPSASLMIVENAERLGLAQLHQLRGRVGRGTQQSVCVLMYQPPLSNLARNRLSILRDTNDGFKIASHDLEQRGGGDLLGTRQTGLQQMRIANLGRDHVLLPNIEKIANALRKNHPDAIQAIIRRWINTREVYAEV